jgi:lipoprotein LprG
VRMRMIAPLVALLLLLAGCSGASDTAERSPTEVLAAAKKNLDATPGLRIGLATEQLPPSVNGLLSAQGVATHAPAFQGSIKVAASGITADAAVVAVDDVVYAKLPFTSRFVPIEPADYGAPDPAALLKPEGGLSSLLTAATDVTAGKQVRDGKVVLSSFSGTVPGEDVASVIPSADPQATFDATFTVDDRDRLAKAVLNGPFYPDADDVTYTITFDGYGLERDIKAP